MSYVLTVIHPPTGGATYGKAVVYVETINKIDTAHGAVGALLKARAEPEVAFRLGLSLVEQPTGVTVGGKGEFAARIDPADNAPHPCPCEGCGRLVLPTDHAYADAENAYCLGCFTWKRDVPQCHPANTAHTEYPEGAISPERWEKLLDRVDEQLAADETEDPDMDNLTGPELFEQSLTHLRDITDPPSVDQDDHLMASVALVHAVNALTAAIILSVETGGDFPPYEIDAWRDVVPRPPLKDKEARRPECTERHTEDCPYADPPQCPPENSAHSAKEN